MRNRLNGVLAMLLAALVMWSGCTKGGSDKSQVPLPNVSSFVITGSTAFAAGTAATVSVYSASLGSGTYKVYFDLAGYNVLTSQSATLVMSNSVGSFTTPKLSNAGTTFLTINSITNIDGGGTAFTQNNKYTLSDSTGLMTALVGSGTIFRATDVLATLSGTAATSKRTLTLRGVQNEPFSSSLTMFIDSFTFVTGTIDFSSYIVPELASFQYQVPGGGFLSANGSIQIATVNPYISGTFWFTGMDSTHVTTGSFYATPPSY